MVVGFGVRCNQSFFFHIFFCFGPEMLMFFSADFFYFFSHDASDLIDKMANGKSVGYMCD
jgi:hypothetical protein